MYHVGHLSRGASTGLSPTPASASYSSQSRSTSPSRESSPRAQRLSPGVARSGDRNERGEDKVARVIVRAGSPAAMAGLREPAEPRLPAVTRLRAQLRR